MKRKSLQLKYRNWWNTGDSSHQIAFLPHFDVWWNYDYIDEDGNPKDGDAAVCIALAW